MATILIGMITVNNIDKADPTKDGQDMTVKVPVEVIVVKQTKEVGETAVLLMINTGIKVSH